MRTIQPGATDKSVTLRALDSTDGTPETGIAFNTAGISLWYRRDGAAAVTITPADLAALTTGHTDGGVKHINHGNFRLDVPDAAFAAGVDMVVIGGSATGMIFTDQQIQLKYEPQALRVATATGGGASTCTLDASASAGTNFYIGNILQILSGTGAGQARLITAYNGTTKVATVDTAWATNPGSGSVFAILPLGILGMAETDLRDAVWDATAASYNDAGTMGEKLNDSGAASAPPSAADNATAVWAAAAATGVTASDVLRLVVATLAGKSSISGTTRNYRNKEDTKNAVVATVVDGERTAVTLNLTQ